MLIWYTTDSQISPGMTDWNQGISAFFEDVSGLLRTLEHPNRQKLPQSDTSMSTYRTLRPTWQNDFAQWIWKTLSDTRHATQTFCREDVQNRVYLPDTRGKWKSPDDWKIWQLLLTWLAQWVDGDLLLYVSLALRSSRSLWAVSCVHWKDWHYTGKHFL